MVRNLCVGGGGRISNYLLHTKSEQKVIGNLIFTPIICKNPLKPGFLNKKYTFKICVGHFWVIIVYFSLEKQTFN